MHLCLNKYVSFVYDNYGFWGVLQCSGIQMTCPLFRVGNVCFLVSSAQWKNFSQQ